MRYFVYDTETDSPIENQPKNGYTLEDAVFRRDHEILDILDKNYVNKYIVPMWFDIRCIDEQ